MNKIRPTLHSLAPLAIALGFAGGAGAQEVSRISGDYLFSCHGAEFNGAGTYRASPSNSRVQVNELTLQIFTGSVPYTKAASPVLMSCTNESVFGARTKVHCTAFFVGANVQFDFVAFSNASGTHGVVVGEYTDPLQARQCTGELKAEKL